MSVGVKRNAVFAAVGKDSLHRHWMKGSETPEFDLHLIVYDDCSEFERDTPFLEYEHGYKLRLIYDYLMKHPEYEDMYDYFLCPDDDVMMDADTVNKIFQCASMFRLKICQPALINSFYSHRHTLYRAFTRLRYTNFVEMMVPCFRRDALAKVKLTFCENKRGWGSEHHWASLIESNRRDMAIIDDVQVVHTRPVQSCTSENIKEGNDYVRKYNLSTTISVWNGIVKDEFMPPDGKIDDETLRYYLGT